MVAWLDIQSRAILQCSKGSSVIVQVLLDDVAGRSLSHVLNMKLLSSVKRAGCSGVLQHLNQAAIRALLDFRRLVKQHVMLHFDILCYSLVGWRSEID